MHFILMLIGCYAFAYFWGFILALFLRLIYPDHDPLFPKKRKKRDRWSEVAGTPEEDDYNG